MENEQSSENMHESFSQQNDPVDNSAENLETALDTGKGKTNPYQSIIDQQNEQIAALIAANQALTQQVTNMVQNGAQFGTPQQTAPQTPQPMQQFNPQPLSEGDDWSLESLAKEIGRK